MRGETCKREKEQKHRTRGEGEDEAKPNEGERSEANNSPKLGRTKLNVIQRYGHLGVTAPRSAKNGQARMRSTNRPAKKSQGKREETGKGETKSRNGQKAQKAGALFVLFDGLRKIF